MTNKTPSSISDFSKQQYINSVDGFEKLAFVDWINKEEYLSSDWIVVAKIKRTKPDEDIFTTSCLVNPTSRKTVKSLFSRDTWDIDVEFGKPYINGDINGEWEFNMYSNVKSGSVNFIPFVTKRYYSSYRPSHFELTQNFLYYYEAFWVDEKREYQTIESNGSTEIIVKHNRLSDDEEELLVDSKYLRNYLALTKSYLVRFHDHRRRYKTAMPFSSNDASYSNKLCNYRIEVYNENFVEGYLSYSRLLGKDIITPLLKPVRDVSTKDTELYEKFVYLVNKNGKDLLYSCEEDRLSSYFHDTGAPHFLTPIYFKKNVLTKYYAESKKYTVDSRHLKCLNLWSIDIDITDQNLVQVWLGDLGRLPHSEQLHWKQFNVSPKGTISEHRFKTDFLAKFSHPEPSELPVSYLRIAYKEINSETQDKFGSQLFLTLDEDDEHHLKSLHAPLTDEWKEFDEQIQSLAKVFCDSLNVKLLETLSKKKIDNKEIKGSISLLYVTLLELGLEEKVRNLIVDSLQAIQTIRSTGSAHRKGEKFNKSLEKYNLSTLTNEAKINQLCLNLYTGLKCFIEAIHD